MSFKWCFVPNGENIIPVCIGQNTRKSKLATCGNYEHAQQPCCCIGGETISNVFFIYDIYTFNI